MLAYYSPTPQFAVQAKPAFPQPTNIGPSPIERCRLAQEAKNTIIQTLPALQAAIQKIEMASYPYTSPAPTFAKPYLQ